MYKETEDMTNKEMFTAIIAHMDSMETRLDSRIEKVETELIGLNVRIENVETGLTRLSERMEEVETGLTGLTVRMENVESELTGLTVRMENVESELTGLTVRMENVETNLTGLNVRMENVETRLTGLETRIDRMESDINIEFQAVRMEMSVSNKSLKKDISILNDKIDRIMIIKDIDGYEKMKVQVDILTQGYQELSEKPAEHKPIVIPYEKSYTNSGKRK